MTINVFPQTPAVVNVEGPGSGVSSATVDAKIATQAAADSATYPTFASAAGTAAGLAIVFGS